MKKENNKFYSLSNILKKDCDYNIIFGERSNGKTFAALEYGIKEFVKSGAQFAYIRRWREDIRGKRGENLFNALIVTGLIEKYTKGEFNTILCKSNKYYFYNSENKVINETPFCFAFALSEQEHEKSTAYPLINTIIFDEFLTRRYYLPDEFILFMNLLSTIIRNRDNVKIFMLGNTVNKFCPYFTEMGLKNIAMQKQGTIDIYAFGADGAKIAVEYTAPTNSEHKKSNKYFCFDNENLQMITEGRWELSVFPHLPCKYKPADILFVYYIIFNEYILQCNIINNGKENFTFIHAKTTPIKNPENALIYSLEQNGKPNFKRKLLSANSELEKNIALYYANDKVFFQSNEIGEIVRNYIKISNKNNLFS